MSGVDNIIKKILDDAEAAAKESEQKARVQASQIDENAALDATKEIDKIIADANFEATQIAKRRGAVLDLELRKSVLTTKRQVIENAYQLAKSKLISSRSDKYIGIMQKLLTECAEAGDGEVFVAPSDEKIFNAALIDKVLKDLDAKGLKRKITIAGLRETIDNGFVYVLKEMEYDCSIDSILRQVRDETETEISLILFKD